MIYSPLILTIFKVAYISMAVSVTAFIIQYSRLAPWWNDPIGRSFVWKDICVLGGALLGILALFFRLNRDISVAISFIVVFGITAIMTWRTFLWSRIQHGKYVEKRFIRKFFKAIYLWIKYGKFAELFRRGNRRRKENSRGN